MKNFFKRLWSGKKSTSNSWSQEKIDAWNGKTPEKEIAERLADLVNYFDQSNCGLTLKFNNFTAYGPYRFWLEDNGVEVEGSGIISHNFAVVCNHIKECIEFRTKKQLNLELSRDLTKTVVIEGHGRNLRFGKIPTPVDKCLI